VGYRKVGYGVKGGLNGLDILADRNLSRVIIIFTRSALFEHVIDEADLRLRMTISI
jgi:hypothetical protein